VTAPARATARAIDRLAPLPDALPAVELRPQMPAGFRCGVTAAGIKASGALDLGVLATTDGPATAAATFTTNRVQAAPVRLSRDHLEATGGRVAAVISTSGCANAATGPAGDRDQTELAASLASSLGVPVEQTLALSTGLIGSRLPVEAIRAGIGRILADGLASTDDALASLAEQLRTRGAVASGAHVHAVAEPPRDRGPSRKRLRPQQHQLPAGQAVKLVEDAAHQRALVRPPFEDDQIALARRSEQPEVDAFRHNVVMAREAECRCLGGLLARRHQCVKPREQPVSL